MDFLNKLFGAKKREDILPIYLFNSLTKEKERFIEILPGNVKIYTCGPTVYNYVTIGNYRSYIFSDTLRRVFEYNSYSVKQIINITDVGHLTSDADTGEDKMMVGLKREGLTINLKGMKALSDRYTKKFKEELKKLNAREALEYPRASEHINEQVAFIKTLEEKDYIYKLKDGIYFDTSLPHDYGQLGGTTKDESKQKARVKRVAGKKQPQDFALWKFNEEIGWDSPWGKGIPGWHIECSAMSSKYLGRHFDIHTGGVDHIAIHHNNEIAQSEAATGSKFVNYWLHNEFITIDKQKISKSTGNTIFIRNLEDKGYSPLALRYWFLTGHYRSSMNFTWEALDGAQTALTKLHKAFLDLGKVNGRIDENYRKRFSKFVNDDLNTPKAIALMWELMDDESLIDKDKRVTLLDFNRVLGIGLYESYKQMKEIFNNEIKKIEVKEAPKNIQELINEREEARNKKDWKEADRLREEIYKEGYKVSDTESGPEIEKS
ncbi:MAG: cysteine--tRNA ligase [Candidatus Pacebacteria bacterium]|jgi:cysteinyl-tRNA synthetase|nr:cysteine--tRNA ligase [bacterium]MDP6528047.1 cysteine--tRNA ligase [Candidatus Paceibacterota bacterium]MDP6659573.1 cysteine--tRNA ligase [Candidatus Paceibacterota bacterium]|tara:strand:- start:7686 stop:9155 length:1470 start_codon:yes stop_codon:yes gene_type:complete